MDYIRRYVDDLLDKLVPELPAIMLTGPRGCGKTTTARRHANSLIRMDDPKTAESFRLFPEETLAGSERPVLLDEWQAVPESLAVIKRVIDDHQQPRQFLVTGSVRSHHSPANWPATGRITPLEMFGLTRGEIENSPAAARTVTRMFAADDPTPTPLVGIPTVSDYLDWAIKGGFPDTLALSDLARSSWYAGYAQQLVSRDASAMADVREPAALARLLHAVALNTAATPTITTLAQAAGIDHRTTRSYLDLLEDMRIIERLPAWGRNKLTRLAKTPKYHLTDSGMAAHLAGDDRIGVLKDASRFGHLIETFVSAQLRPLLRLQVPMVSAFHLRNTNGTHEVDLILEATDGRIVGMEVKSAAAVTKRDARHLIWLRDSIGDEFVRGFVLYTGRFILPLDDRIWAMPISCLWRGW